jgi:phosphotransferase system enzyme I (PtsI)
VAILNEIHIKCRAVSRGIAIGTAVCLYGTRKQFLRRKVSSDGVKSEIDRLDAAFGSARAAIEDDIARAKRDARNAASDILDSHLLILDDPTIRTKVVEIIETDRVNVESAVHEVLEEFASRFRANPDQVLREKSIDIEDVCDRLLTALIPEAQTVELGPNSILIAKEIRPSSLLEILDRGVVGLAAESGGWTSHTSILAREAKIPAVTGIAKIGKRIRDGQPVIVDGFSGEVIIDPAEETIESYQSLEPANLAVAATVNDEDKFLSTIDGRDVLIRTNTVSVSSYESAAANGARGIGLYRSESLIGRFKRIPTEDEQTREYIAVANATGIDGLRVRTFDVDADQFLDAATQRQKNPALGLRAIRLGMMNPDLLVPQIRALLRASHDRNIGIIVPMVTGTSEIVSVRQIIAEESEHLASKDVSIGSPAVGAMIEIPSAVLVADQLAETCDFLCLGTNDLAQYLLAADRDNESVSPWFRTLHPAMIKAVGHVIKSAVDATKPLTVCGEMAGSPFYVPVLIGLGATELSMNPGSIEAVSRVVAGIAFEEALKLVSEIEVLTTADDVEATVRSTAQGKWAHLFSSGFLEVESH